ncbi:MAG TPA: ABC transporter permease [Ureibacillus sp.]|nr:ABC transporter permease [Ureibacillus sp.]
MGEKTAQNNSAFLAPTVEQDTANIPFKREVAKTKKKLNLRNSSKVLIPSIAGVLFLLLWEFQVFHAIFQLQTYQLPIPTAILDAFIDNFSTLITFTGYTLTEAVLGMLLGSAIGFMLALIASAFPKWGKSGLMIVVALNAVPIVALAPIMNLWFGNGMGSRIAIVTITTLAAMAINSYKGLSNVNPLALDLMYSYAAKKIEVFRYLKIANSLPYVFTALKINTTASMIAAIVGEFFYSSKGLGYLLSNSIKVAQMPLGWSCIVIASIAGVLFYLIVEGLEKVFLGWHASERT